MSHKIIAFATVLGFIFSSCDPKQEPILPKLSNITESVYASGVITSQNQYEVYTKLNGIVGEIMVKEGARIKKGDLLFQIDNPNASLSADNARLAAAANDYTANIGKLNDARNAIELANKKYISDSLLYERQKKLWAQNIGSQSDLEQKELNAEKSKMSWKQAKIAYEDLERQLALASNQSKNNLKIARLLESDRLIKSAAEGIVYKINIRRGELATAAAPLAVIGADSFIIELNIDEFDIVKIRQGQRVLVRMDSYKSEVFEALVAYIHPMMNERTRTFKVEALFVKPPQVLYPNLTLEANIIIREKQGVLTIPSSYLLADSSVLLQDGSKRKLKLGLKDYQLTEIESGLDANTQIVAPEK